MTTYSLAVIAAGSRKSPQAAEFLGVHYITLHRWIAEGKAPPHLRIGTNYYFPAAELEAFKAAREANKGTSPYMRRKREAHDEATA